MVLLEDSFILRLRVFSYPSIMAMLVLDDQMLSLLKFAALATPVRESCSSS